MISLQDHYEELREEIGWFYNLNYYEFKLGPIKKTISVTSERVEGMRKLARHISYGICLMMVFFITLDHDTTEK